MIKCCDYRLAIDIVRRECLVEKRPCTLITLGIPCEIVLKDVACGLGEVHGHEWRLRCNLYTANSRAVKEQEMQKALSELSQAPLHIVSDEAVKPSTLANISDERDVFIISGQWRFSCEEYARRKSCGDTIEKLLAWFSYSIGQTLFEPHEAKATSFISSLKIVAKDMVSCTGLKYFSEPFHYHEFERVFCDVVYYAILNTPDWSKRVRDVLETPDCADLCRPAKSRILAAAINRRYIDASKDELVQIKQVLASGGCEDPSARDMFRYVRDNPFDMKRWTCQLDKWHHVEKIGEMRDDDGHNALWYLFFNRSLFPFWEDIGNNSPFCMAYNLLQQYGCSELHRDKFGLPTANIREALK